MSLDWVNESDGSLRQASIREALSASRDNNMAMGVWFLQPSHRLADQLRSDFVVPDLLKPVRGFGPLLSVGGLGRGGHFNRHDENWLAQLYGRKRWLLLSPKDGEPLELINRHPCTIHEEDVLFAKQCVVNEPLW